MTILYSEKQCIRCGEIKNLELFGVRKVNKDGRQGACKACRSADSAAWKKENPEKVKAGNKAYYKENKETILEKSKIYNAKVRATDPDKIRAYSRKQWKVNRAARQESTRKWREANPDKVREKKIRWQSENPERHKISRNIRNRRRYANQRKAVPSWANHRIIRMIYTKSHRLSVWLDQEFHVDHIIPIQSEFVCGLPCESNLSIIPAKDNMVKNNLVWPDMWEKE